MAGDILAIPGIAESALTEDAAARLPGSAPAAPWTCAADGIVWYSRRPGRALPAEAELGGRAVGVFGGFMQYRDTPVGEYGEVFGGVALLQGRTPVGTIPFMAVDSPRSVVGGRANWSLPKTLARFEGAPATGHMSATGPGWTVRASARPLAPTVPFRMGGRLVQRWPDGTARTAVLRGRSRLRPAIITVEVESSGALPAWLRPGRHLGGILLGASFELPAPR